MQIHRIEIENFRGIKSLKWNPPPGLICLIGPGDAGKTSILDAIEATLGNKWTSYNDADFFDGNTDLPITITITIGRLSQEFLSDSKWGLYLRGWTPTAEIVDEPDSEDEPVITITLNVDKSLEPVWSIYTERHDPRILSSRDRAQFGIFRLGQDVERHFTWAQNSALAKLGHDKSTVSQLLAEAYRTARKLISEKGIEGLKKISEKIGKSATQIGAYTDGNFAPGLDPQKASPGAGGLTLHEKGIPLRLAGTGSRRLIALAIQNELISNASVLIVDEVEGGLEPHRVRQLVRYLVESVGQNGEQVIVTSHSPSVLVDLNANQLSVVRNTDGIINILSPDSSMQKLVRTNPESFLAKRILVCEGKTEIGICRGLRDYWTSQHKEPIENRGVVFCDGKGSEQIKFANKLASLGYEVALFRDSDVVLMASDRIDLASKKIEIFEWTDNLSTEERIFSDVSIKGVQILLDIAVDKFGIDSVKAVFKNETGVEASTDLKISEWTIPGKTELDLRGLLAKTAKNRDWYKEIDSGEKIGLMLSNEIPANSSMPTSIVLKKVENWLYG